ncbi:MAG: nucleotide sugar dehydrogenase [Candidatus Omnitrophota bacterium]
MSAKLKQKIASKSGRIAVMGLGYVGLPLAVSFARAGFSVYGLDTDQERVDRIVRKENYIGDIPDALLSRLVDRKKLTASTDLSLLQQADVVIICVPTPLKRKYTPDVSFITKAVKTVSKHLHKNMLVVCESTTYPGTTQELILPGLERSGLKLGRDFFLAFSPERIDPGNKKFDVTRIPKVVGGVDRRSGELAKVLYQTIIKKIHVVSSASAAEMTKLLENSFRIINIGWINEVAVMCHHMGIDIWEVIEAAKTKPFGFMPFYPGLGVGGHCIPDDPLYLYWKARTYGFSSKYIKLSADINAQMPNYVVERVAGQLAQRDALLSRARILVLGVTYKKDVKDLRKSPALKLMDLLQGAAQRVDYHDPLIPYLDIFRIHNKDSIELTPQAIKSYDCVIIATDHSAVDYDRLLRHARLIFDTRNVYGRSSSRKVVRL